MGQDPEALKHRYQEFILQAIEDYKNGLPRTALLELGNEAAAALHAATEGRLFLTEMVMLETVDRIILQRLRLPSFNEWRKEEDLDSVVANAIIGPGGAPATPTEAKPLLFKASEISLDLIEHLAKRPDELHALSPRRFEELVADLLSRQGYEVELTPSSRDGGKDVIASFHTSLGRFLLYIECKRYAPSNPVGVKIVREILGVVHQSRASAGMVVTTSFFTSGAYDIANADPYRLALHDYNKLLAWLRRVARVA